MNEHLAKTYSKMLWVTFIVGGLILAYYFMPEPLQVWIMDKIEWAFNKIGVKFG